MGYKKKTAYEVLLQMGEIKRLQAMGHSDQEIIKEMRLRRATYYHYSQKIFRQERSELAKHASGDIAHEIMLLKERLVRTLRNCESIATNETMTPYIRLEAERLKVETAVNILRLMIECPYVIETKNGNDELVSSLEQNMENTQAND